MGDTVNGRHGTCEIWYKGDMVQKPTDGDSFQPLHASLKYYAGIFCKLQIVDRISRSIVEQLRSRGKILRLA